MQLYNHDLQKKNAPHDLCVRVIKRCKLLKGTSIFGVFNETVTSNISKNVNSSNIELL